MRVKQNFCFVDARPERWEGPILQTRGQKIVAVVIAAIVIAVIIAAIVILR